jgi:hypothetical protein
LDEHEYRVRIASLVCLTVIVVAAIAGMTVTAAVTDRDLTRVEILTFAVTLWLAVLGGMSTWGWMRRYRWRVEREAVNGRDSYRTGLHRPEPKEPPDAS